MPIDEFNKIDEEFFDTILEEDFSFEGSIKVKDSIIIKGYIKGKLESEGTVVVGPNSVVDADIISKNLQCFGKINGNIIAEEEIVLHSPSVINGDITTKSMNFEKGCILNGRVQMNKT
ncbi:MAG TPA: polymer-forming cytoskeletal protein [Spirochaetota bacterium]|nr:polymer-forming cytoskeletal protein [Spirochaetota bacterium]HOL57253.1 polymer-forming cytoskeletal protein [Spirochaetota bacterium]HPP03513.1 polymer-forming cytoskeletal protein [Spirochaetota bacterium]